MYTDTVGSDEENNAQYHSSFLGGIGRFETWSGKWLT